MENYIPETCIEDSPNPLTIEGTETILFQMKNCLCKILGNDGKKGTGFFCKIPYLKKLLPVLITNNHILDENKISKDKKIELTLNDDKKVLVINLDNSRIKIINKELDITFIEIKKEDNINNFLEIDKNIDKGLQNIYNHKSIYLLHYPKGVKANVSYGLSGKIIGDHLIHFCSTEKGSSGAPILLLDSFKVIGIHIGTTKNKNLFFNLGTLIKKGIRLFSSKENFINDNKNTNNNIFINKLANNSNINNLKINKTINLSQNNNLINKDKNINFKESMNNFFKNNKLQVRDMNNNIILPQLYFGNLFCRENQNDQIKVNAHIISNRNEREEIETTRDFIETDEISEIPGLQKNDSVACKKEREINYSNYSNYSNNIYSQYY